MNSIEDQLEYIKNTINNHVCIVDQSLLDYFQRKVAEGSYSCLKNAQAEALEESLRRIGLLKQRPPVPGEKYSWRHDWWYMDILTDLKRKPSWSNKITISNIKTKGKQSHELGELNYYTAYEQNYTELLKVGDRLTFKYIHSIPFMEAYKKIEDKGDYGLLIVQ